MKQLPSEQDSKTREILNLFRESLQKNGRIFQIFGGEAHVYFYGLFEWKKSAGHVQCKVCREYYDCFFC